MNTNPMSLRVKIYGLLAKYDGNCKLRFRGVGVPKLLDWPKGMEREQAKCEFCLNAFLYAIWGEIYLWCLNSIWTSLTAQEFGAISFYHLNKLESRYFIMVT